MRTYFVLCLGAIGGSILLGACDRGPAITAGTYTCSSNADCTTSHVCRQIDELERELCVRRGATCEDDTNCSDNRTCLSGYCLRRRVAEPALDATVVEDGSTPENTSSDSTEMASGDTQQPMGERDALSDSGPERCRYLGRSKGVCSEGTRLPDGGCQRPTDWMSATPDERDRCSGRDNDCDGAIDEGCQWAEQFDTTLEGTDLKIQDVTSIVNTSSAYVYVGGIADKSQSTSKREVGFVAKYHTTGTREWLKTIATVQDSVSVRALALGPKPHLYVAGSTNGPIGDQKLIGGRDGFVAVYNRRSGVREAIELFGSEDDEAIADLARDDSNDFYVAGATDKGFGEAADTYSGAGDAFVARYQFDGSRLERKDSWLIGTLGRERATTVETDSKGRVYVGGYAQSDLESEMARRFGSGFVARYNSTGDQQWVRQWGESQSAFVSDLSVEGTERLFVAGVTRMALDSTQSTQEDGFVLALDLESQQTKWSELLQTDMFEQTSAIEQSPRGQLYVVGGTEGEPGVNNVNAGNRDGVLAIFDKTGDRKSLQLLPSEGGYDALQAVGARRSDHVYVGGSLSKDNGSSDGFLKKIR